MRKGLGYLKGLRGPGRSEVASQVEGSVGTAKGETMIRAKVLAGMVTGGLMMVGVMGCQQAPPPAPATTVVVDHHGDGQDRDHHPPPPPAQRPQDQRDPNRKDAPPPPR